MKTSWSIKFIRCLILIQVVCCLFQILESINKFSNNRSKNSAMSWNTVTFEKNCKKRSACNFLAKCMEVTHKHTQLEVHWREENFVHVSNDDQITMFWREESCFNVLTIYFPMVMIYPSNIPGVKVIWKSSQKWWHAFSPQKWIIHVGKLSEISVKDMIWKYNIVYIKECIINIRNKVVHDIIYGSRIHNQFRWYKIQSRWC